MKIERYGMVIRLKPDKEQEYRELHRAVWPEVMAVIRACHMQNYSIYLKDGYLFSYYEYTGDDHGADMRKMAADPATQRWWALCEPCQEPVAARARGEWWARMDEVFHME